jgi:uncharacterized protein
VLHKQWAKLENEHHELAIAIDAAQAKKADVALMRKRQESLLLEINPLVAEIRNAPATTIEDFLALLDVALDHELDLACEMAFCGPADYPIITRLFRVLAREIPGFEFNSLRRWLSVPGQFEQVMGRATHLETAENDGQPDEPLDLNSAPGGAVASDTTAENAHLPGLIASSACAAHVPRVAKRMTATVVPGRGFAITEM